MTSIGTSLTSTPEVDVSELTVVLKQEYIIEGLMYVRVIFRKGRHFITEKDTDIKNYP
jgi:hypothetical protein